MGVDDDADIARALLGSRMEDFYRQPFESFERYSPSGPPAAIAGFLAPYIEAGARHIHLIPGDLEQERVLESALAVREGLAAVCALEPALRRRCGYLPLLTY